MHWWYLAGWFSKCYLNFAEEKWLLIMLGFCIFYQLYWHLFHNRKKSVIHLLVTWISCQYNINSPFTIHKGNMLLRSDGAVSLIHCMLWCICWLDSPGACLLLSGNCKALGNCLSCFKLETYSPDNTCVQPFYYIYNSSESSTEMNAFFVHTIKLVTVSDNVQRDLHFSFTL